MTFAAPQPLAGVPPVQRTTTVCRIHTCVRCKVSIDNNDPCSFARTELRICGSCRGQEQVLRHLPVRRSNWSHGLARLAA